MSDDLPDPIRLGRQLAELHRKSISPTGKFGFHVPTYDRRLPQVVDWDSSWASFFGKMLLGTLQLDIEVNSPWKELEEVVGRTVKEVIPILLGNLETEGRSLKPCLIHGDLWKATSALKSDLETYSSLTLARTMRTMRWRLACGGPSTTV